MLPSRLVSKFGVRREECCIAPFNDVIQDGKTELFGGRIKFGVNCETFCGGLDIKFVEPLERLCALLANLGHLSWSRVIERVCLED